MTRRLLLTLSVLTLLGAAAPRAAAEDAPRRVRLEFVYLSIGSVTTDTVASAVRKRVLAVPGVRSFAWTQKRREAKVVRVVGQAGHAKLIAACRAAGAGATPLAVAMCKLTFETALRCSNCVAAVTKALEGLKGTKEIHVAKDMLTVSVVYDTKVASVKQMRRALDAAGHPVKT